MFLLQRQTVEDADQSLSSQEPGCTIIPPAATGRWSFILEQTRGQGTLSSMQSGVERTNSFARIADHRTCA